MTPGSPTAIFLQRLSAELSRRWWLTRSRRARIREEAAAHVREAAAALRRDQSSATEAEAEAVRRFGDIDAFVEQISRAQEDTMHMLLRGSIGLLATVTVFVGLLDLTLVLTGAVETTSIGLLGARLLVAGVIAGYGILTHMHMWLQRVPGRLVKHGAAGFGLLGLAQRVLGAGRPRPRVLGRHARPADDGPGGGDLDRRRLRLATGLTADLVTGLA